MEEKVVAKVNDLMRASGLNEIITSSLIGKSLLDKYMVSFDPETAVYVQNAASEEYSMLRQTLSASVLNVMKSNYDNGQKTFWGYELGKTYKIVSEADEKSSGVKEAKTLAGILTGSVENSKWQQSSELDFYTIKGIFEHLFAQLGVERRIKLANCESIDYMHPYRTAQVLLLGKKPEPIGYFGQIHPLLKDKLKLNQDAFMFELDIDAIISAVKETVPRFKHLPQFPEVRRDLAFIIDEKVSFEEIQKVIKGAVQQNIFKGSEVFDVYQGEHVDNGYKSLAFRIKMQDESATLTDEIIEKQMQSVREKLQKTYADIAFRE